MKLGDYHEIVGTLENYIQEEDRIKLVFKIQTVIELPIGAIPKNELDDCINRKIGIFNNKGDYRLRKFPMPIEHFKTRNARYVKNGINALEMAKNYFIVFSTK